jgi:hypothetical protein
MSWKVESGSERNSTCATMDLPEPALKAKEGGRRKVKDKERKWLEPYRVLGSHLLPVTTPPPSLLPEKSLVSG